MFRAKLIVKYYHRAQKKSVANLAVELFGSQLAMKEHFRRARTRYNGWAAYLEANKGAMPTHFGREALVASGVPLRENGRLVYISTCLSRIVFLFMGVVW